MRKFPLLLVLAFVLAPFSPAQTAAGSALVQGKRAMTFEDMMHLKRLGETAVSADGKWLAYSATTVNLDQNTKTTEWFIQPIAGGEPMKLAITQPGDSGVQFARDGHAVLFISGRGGSHQVWLADFDAATGATSNAKKLTNIATDAGDAIWSPDGNSILFDSAVYPDCPAITTADFATGNKCNADRDAALAARKVKAQIFTQLLYRHWDHFTGPKRSHLFLATVATGAVRDLTPNNPHDVPPFSLDGGGCGCAISPDSKELAYTDNIDPVQATSVSAKIFTLDLTNPEAKPVAVSTSKGGNFNPAYSPDGKYLAWRSEARAGYESDLFKLMVYDRAAKTIKDLLPKFDNWVNEIAWAPNSKEIFFTTTLTGENPLLAATLDGKVETISENGTFGDLHPLPDNKTVVASRNSIQLPSEVVSTSAPVTTSGAKTPFKVPGIAGYAVVESETVATIQNITNLNTELWMQLDEGKLEDFWFTTADKTKLQGFLIRPPAFDPAKKYPVKFLIHGGPQGAWGDDWSYRWNPELFAANGYVVIMINMRGSTGYGQTIVDGVNGDWGGKPFTDLMEGLDAAERKFPFIDKNRECALGASYGGYMANWVEGHTNRFKCIVSHDGMFNAESAFGTTEEDWFNIWEFKGHPWDYYGKPDAENPFRKWSPSLSAKNFHTPMLVVHGQLDYRLDVSEGFQLFDTLQLLGVPSKMLYFPDEGHWVLKPQNARLWYKTVNDWVDQWTKSSR